MTTANDITTADKLRDEVGAGGILVVDDNTDSRNILGDLLTRHGYDVRSVDSGQLALNAVRSKAPDLILLDVKMPGMDGYEVCQKLKSDPSLKGIPVIFISVHGDTIDKVLGFDLGGVDFITKPFDGAEVLARIRIHLALHKLNHQLERLVEQRTADLAELNHQLQSEVEERMRTEADLAGEKALLRCVMDSIPDLIFYKDKEGGLIGCNKAYEAYAGRGQNEQIGPSDTDLLSREQAEFRRRQDQTVLTSGKPSRFEEEGRYPDGRQVILDTLITPYYGPDLDVLGLVGISRDITEDKKSEEERYNLTRQLRQTQKLEAIGTLAGGIAHDFNNILSSIIGFAELAMEDAPADSLLEDNLNEVYLAGMRARGLVNQILTFARKSEEEYGPVQIGLIAKEVLKLLRAILPVSVEITQEILSSALVLSDPTHIHQVFMNLCTNAAHAMEDNGGIMTVEVSDIRITDPDRWGLQSLSPGQYVRIRIGDTGVGIPASDLDLIFEPYFTTKDPKEGTGLGLSVVHGIVNSCKGEIHVSSVTGQGSLFTVYLPIAEFSQDPRPKQVDIEPKGNECILIVDDEVATAKMHQRVLERYGYTVTACTNSQAALALFQNDPQQFDLVLTDMTMPKLSGDSLAQQIRLIRRDIPIVLCTGYHKRMTEEQALKVGFDAFEMKPLTKTILLRTVRRVLDQPS